MLIDKGADFIVLPNKTLENILLISQSTKNLKLRNYITSHIGFRDTTIYDNILNEYVTDGDLEFIKQGNIEMTRCY